MGTAELDTESRRTSRKVTKCPLWRSFHGSKACFSCTPCTGLPGARSQRRRGRREPRPGQAGPHAHSPEGSLCFSLARAHSDSPKHKASPLGSNESIKDRDSERMTPRGFGTCCDPHPLSQVNVRLNRDEHEHGKEAAGRGRAHTPAACVGVLGWLRPMVVHSQPAKSTSSASDLLMKA